MSGCRARLAAVLAVALLGATACSGGGPSRASAPASRGRAVRYVALGGDDAYGGPRSTLSWPQQLFRTALPTRAVFVNLASPRRGAAEVLQGQVDDARALHPDVVTITLADDLEHATRPEVVATDLASIIERLRAGGDTAVLVGTAPAGIAAPAASAAFDSAIRQGAAAGGATVVGLGSVDGTDFAIAAREIAAAFARALPASVTRS